MNRCNRCYVNSSVKFRRLPEDGLVHAVCDGPVEEGEIVCYEIPVRSTGKNTKIDTLRYTMQCVYGGEFLFPCAFNQEAPSEDVKVFFDYVFRTEYKRGISEKLALALYTHNRTNQPFIFKTLGIFQDKCAEIPTCLRISYDNGETFLVASRRLEGGEILTASPSSLKIPTLKQELDFATTMRFMSDVDLSQFSKFSKALSYRDKAALVRPKGRVDHVNSNLDPDLDKRLAKYLIDREMGISDFYVSLDRLSKKKQSDDDLDTDMAEMEELYEKLNKEFELIN